MVAACLKLLNDKISICILDFARIKNTYPITSSDYLIVIAAVAAPRPQIAATTAIGMILNKFKSLILNKK